MRTEELTDTEWATIVAMRQNGAIPLAATDVAVFSDGACWPNPGQGAVAAIVLGPDGTVLVRRAERIGPATNNQAEYRAIALGLQMCSGLGARRVRVHSDSTLAVNQISGRWKKAKNPRLRELRDDARALAEQFDEVTFQHVPREHPWIIEADCMAGRVLKEVL